MEYVNIIHLRRDVKFYSIKFNVPATFKLLKQSITWRRRWDSNPREPCGPNRFRDGARTTSWVLLRNTRIFYMNRLNLSKCFGLLLPIISKKFLTSFFLLNRIEFAEDFVGIKPSFPIVSLGRLERPISSFAGKRSVQLNYRDKCQPKVIRS